MKTISFLVLLTLYFADFGDCGTKNDYKVKSPCSITRHIKTSNPVIRIVDEVNDQPGVILGQEGLQYYTLISSRVRREVVIECSSSQTQVKWVYKGVGASSTFKVVNTRWTPGADISRPANCFSSALVISHVTDQLTGEYRCSEVNSTRVKKGPRKNSFKLFVPSITPDYPEVGEVNVTVSNSQEKIARVRVPCITKMTSESILLYIVTEEGLELAKYKHMKYDPFSGFIIPQSSIQFQGSRILKHECRFESSNATLLKVNFVLESEEKIAPEKDLVKASAPYFSWTTKSNPELVLTPDVKPNVVIWQQFFTKKGYEEISPGAAMFYLGSASLVNLTSGMEGQVSLVSGNESIHKWNYQVLDAEAEQNAGMKYDDYELFHVFVCKSASPEKPIITFKAVEEGPKNVTGHYNITDCSDGEYGKVGCVMLTSYLHQGEVKCVGDGVDETIRYPPQPFEAGRPFFLERGEKLEVILSPDADRTRIPCLTNSEASTSVFLYKRMENGFKKIWSEDDEEFESDIEFYPTSGFHLSQTTSGETQDLVGEYLCSSSVNPNDTSDSVKVLVKREIGTNFKVLPSERRVFGRTPFKLSWEADEELEIVSESPIRNLSLGHDATDKMYGFGGKLIIMETTGEGETRSLSLRRKMDGLILHEWVFTQIGRDGDHHAGLHVDMKEDKGESLIVAVCRSKTKMKPRIRYYHCQNENSCEMMKRCHQRDCYNPSFPHEDATILGLVENCEEDHGCSAIVIRSLFINGFLNISCTGDGVDEHRLFKDVFFKDDITWNTEEDDGYIHLSTAFAVHAADQDPSREIQHIGANVEWELGETVEFTCVAAPFQYSHEIKWAVETKQGKMIYQKDSIFDSHFKYVGATQIASTFSLLIDSMDYSRIYCFVPLLNSPTEWRNASMSIFVRPDPADDYCHENSIHLINVYPSPSKLNLQLNETKLNQLPYFVVPPNLKQFAVKISGPKPFTWTFNGAGDGPSRTPLIQSDRQILDYFDSSTYCYSSRLLLNLRHKNANDTGRYSVKHRYQSQELGSFYIFVPSENPPYLLGSGGEINVTLPEDPQPIHIPCLVNNPEIKVELMKDNTLMSGVVYDPTRGFLLDTSTVPSAADLEGGDVLKCVANGNESDSLVVYVNPPIRNPELKYEKVNDFHVFTCKTGSLEPPQMTLTEMANNGTPIENSTQFKMTRCSGGCMTLITQVNQGSVSCVGDGVDETYRFPPKNNANQRNSDKPVGLWYDNTTNTFKCQTNTLEAPQLAAVTCRRPNECEIMKRLLKGRGDLSQATYSECGEGCAELQVKTAPHTNPNWFSIFLRCKGEDNMELLSQYFYDKGKMTYASIENAEQFRRIRIDVPGFRKHGKMLVATFRCFANRYFYSRGIQWGLEGKNGILEFPPTPASQVEVQSFSAIMSSISLEIDENVHTAVYCFVPLIDSPAWANSTVKLPIDQIQINI